MTIKDLAALSGYSLGTVSRVLNNQPHVSEKAREQIMAIVKAHGFELNMNARSLKQTHSNNILVVVRGTHNELFAALVERLQTVATGGEYRLVVDYIGELDNEVRRAVKRVREVKPQGILFLGGSSQNFSESFAGIDIPAVLVTNSAAELQCQNLSSVTTDDTAAADAQIVVGKSNGAGLAIGIAAGAGAIGMGLAVAKSAEGISRQPEAEGKIRTTLMLGLVFIETAIIYALLAVILIIFVL